MLVEVSIGEVIDKLSILDIKKSKILDPARLECVEREYAALSEAKKHIAEFPNSFWYAQLVVVNTRIWDLTDEVRSFAWSSDTEKFARLSNTIFDLNQQRFRLKERLNHLCNSEIQEQKGYGLSTFTIPMPSLEVFYKSLAYINKKSLEYDRIDIVTPCVEEVKKIYSYFPFTVTLGSAMTTGPEALEERNDLYDFNPINYVAGGKLGDFIMSLSVVAENFRNTGRKGNLFLSSRGDNFRNPLDLVMNDTRSIIKYQDYIQSYEFYTDQPCDVDLTAWRISPLIYRASWHHIYKSTYGVNWGMRQWIKAPYNPEFANKICIHSAPYRMNTNLNLSALIQNNPDLQVIFISSQDSEYEAYISATGFKELPFIKLESFEEMCSAIFSCRFFIGNLSMPLALADSMFKNRMSMLAGNPDDIHQVMMGGRWLETTMVPNL